MLHYENLVHRILEFNQRQWLKPYIEFNSQKRIEAEKKWREIMNNAIYEKTMENLRSRIDVRLGNN